MSEPPSSGRPTGPPSGPLSGSSDHEPTQVSGTPPPPTTPGAGGRGGPSGPSGPGGSGGGPSGSGGSGASGGSDGPEGADGSGGGGAPWWKSVPRVVILTAVVVAVIVVSIVVTRPGGGGGSGSGGDVRLEAAGETGPNPFTESTAEESSPPPSTPNVSKDDASPNTAYRVNGAQPGLYGGTRNVASCDVEQQIDVLGRDSAKNRAFASVAGIEPGQVPGYLRSLTPVQLRVDTRVTNHGYVDGSASPYQAILQAGTAVLVDARGVPRVRCACGNPLTPPAQDQSGMKVTGDAWPGFRASNTVVVEPAPQVVKVFVIYDPEHKEWIQRHEGDDTGKQDKKTKPPKDSPTITGSPSDPSSPDRPSSPSTPTTPPTSPSTPSSPDSDSPSDSSPPSTEAPSTESSPPTTAEENTTSGSAPSSEGVPPASG